MNTDQTLRDDCARQRLRAMTSAEWLDIFIRIQKDFAVDPRVHPGGFYLQALEACLPASPCLILHPLASRFQLRC